VYPSQTCSGPTHSRTASLPSITMLVLVSLGAMVFTSGMFRALTPAAQVSGTRRRRLASASCRVGRRNACVPRQRARERLCGSYGRPVAGARPTTRPTSSTLRCGRLTSCFDGPAHQMEAGESTETDVRPLPHRPAYRWSPWAIQLCAAAQDQMGFISSRLRPVVRGPISAITAIVAARAATTTVNIAAAP
jgi:hypothetical protein